jgi:hypothetical protein
MPKDWDEGNKRIEGIFGQIGLGNQDPEKLAEFVDDFEKAMNTAEQSGKKTGVKFKDVMDQAEANETPDVVNVEVSDEEKE